MNICWSLIGLANVRRLRHFYYINLPALIAYGNLIIIEHICKLCCRAHQQQLGKSALDLGPEQEVIHHLSASKLFRSIQVTHHLTSFDPILPPPHYSHAHQLLRCYNVIFGYPKIIIIFPPQS